MSESTTEVHDEQVVNRAGRPQGMLLMFVSCLPVLGAVLLAPVLPSMEQHFAGTPYATALVPVTLTVPALMIGLLAPFAGRIVDRFGRKRLLVGALVTYAFFGTAPLYLTGLPAIVLSRVGVGITEAAIMTCCTTLIADYFSGAARDRWLAMQTVFASLSATLFFALGGALGSLTWRAPFWLYASSLLFALLAARLLWQPTPRSAFLDNAGVKAVGAIGAVTAIASAATATGAFIFGRTSRFGTRTLLPIAFALAGTGLVIVGLTTTVPVIVIGAVIAASGTGLMLPTLLTWALSALTYDQRGRGTGLWTATLFIGEFACPLLILAISTPTGGLGRAVVVVGAAAILLAVTTRLRFPSPASIPA